ncbi:(E,E)-geranyllinalool synthase-like [Carica papaya]|uniref:(E,E)-geranyllinalool synthase-like n=1 Tax=Carica papaya TaxID=3649 RepID=UPI000B8D073F|nr:(E,E)-geranyllinalool synthase-like [Carica papaya]
MNKFQIEYELRSPWIARLDHLEHRMWIEQKDSNACWMGKASFHRLSNLQNNKLIQLATKNFEYRQSIFKNELDHHLKGWTTKWGFDKMRFAREKTTDCYFAFAASNALDHYSNVRIILTKAAILITVADDFFDMEGSLHDLQILADAVQRWDSNGLTGHSKKIFNALDDLVTDFAAKYLQYQGIDITNHVRDLWRETFMSWLTEATWSKTGCVPSMDEYLQTGMISIAAHTLVLPAACFLNPSLPNEIFKSFSYEYQTLTKLVMLICRLLNDTQSYQKEQEQGKLNSVLLHMRENPDVKIEDSVAYVKDIIDKKSKELLEHVLMDDLSDMPKSCKQLHLSIFKVFQMFFHSCNRFNTDTHIDILQDVQKAIYLPLAVQPSKPWKQQSFPQLPHHASSGLKKDYQLRINSRVASPFKQYHNSRINIVATHQISKPPLQVFAYNNKMASSIQIPLFAMYV